MLRILFPSLLSRLKILGEIFAEIANMSGSSSGGCWFLAVVVGKKTLDTMARDTSNFPQGEIVKKEHTRNMKMPIAESAICVRFMVNIVHAIMWLICRRLLSLKDISTISKL